MPGESWLQCYHCGREFRDKFNLKRHIALHLRPLKEANRICCMCTKSFLNRDDVLQHYMFDHNVEIHPKRLEFENFTAFENWKINLERREKSVFVKKRGTHVNKNGISKMYYWCQRDGFTPQDRQVFGQRKRRLKKTGYNQINICCPASMKAVVLPDGRVSVNYVATHVGHEAEVERLKLLKSDKAAIAKLIEEGRSFMDILKDFRLRPKDGSDDRLRILNLRDLDNIARKFNVRPKNSRSASHLDQCTSENKGFVSKQPSEPKSVLSEEPLHQKLDELNKIWEDIKSKVTNAKEADFVLKMLLPILTSLQKTPKLPQVLEEQTSRSNLPANSARSFMASEPPPLVFYSDKLTKNNVTRAMVLRSSEPPKLVPMTSRKLTKPVVHNENLSPGVERKMEAERLLSLKTTKPKPANVVPEVRQLREDTMVKSEVTTGKEAESQNVTPVTFRKGKRKMSSQDKAGIQVGKEQTTQVPPLVPTKSRNTKLCGVTTEEIHPGQGDQKRKAKPVSGSISAHLQPSSQRATRAATRSMIPNILRSSRSCKKIPSEKTQVSPLSELKRVVEHSYSRQKLGQPSALVKVNNSSEPPPLVFLPPKKNPSADIIIADVKSLASEVESIKRCFTLRSDVETPAPTIPPPLPIKVALNDVRMQNPSDPPKLVLIPSVAQKLIDMKQLCLQGDSGYLINKVEPSS